MPGGKIAANWAITQFIKPVTSYPYLILFIPGIVLLLVLVTHWLFVLMELSGPGETMSMDNWAIIQHSGLVHRCWSQVLLVLVGLWLLLGLYIHWVLLPLVFSMAGDGTETESWALIR